MHQGLHLGRVHGCGGGVGPGQPPGLVMIVRFDLLPFGGIGDAAPPPVDFRRVDLLGNHGRGERRRRRFHHGGIDEELVADPAGKLGAVVLRPIAVGLAHELQRLDAVLGTRGNLGVIRAAIENHRARSVSVDDGDVGDVHRVVDDGDIALARHQDIAHYGRAEVAVFTEGIGRGADVVVAVHPNADARARLKHRVGRQRRPANVIVAPPPGDPRRAPLVTRLPDPAVILEANPAAIMAGDGAEVLVGNPRPARIRVAPVAVGVGAPIAFQPPGLPAIAVGVHIHPRAVGRKAVVKKGERDARLGLPGQGRAKQNG